MRKLPFLFFASFFFQGLIHCAKYSPEGKNQFPIIFLYQLKEKHQFCLLLDNLLLCMDQQIKRKENNLILEISNEAEIKEYVTKAIRPQNDIKKLIEKHKKIIIQTTNNPISNSMQLNNKNDPPENAYFAPSDEKNSTITFFTKNTKNQYIILPLISQINPDTIIISPSEDSITYTEGEFQDLVARAASKKNKYVFISSEKITPEGHVEKSKVTNKNIFLSLLALTAVGITIYVSMNYKKLSKKQDLRTL